MTPDYESEMYRILNPDLSLNPYLRTKAMTDYKFVCGKCKKTWTPFEMREAQLTMPGQMLFCCPDCERK